MAASPVAVSLVVQHSKSFDYLASLWDLLSF